MSEGPMQSLGAVIFAWQLRGILLSHPELWWPQKFNAIRNCTPSFAGHTRALDSIIRNWSEPSTLLRSLKMSQMTKLTTLSMLKFYQLVKNASKMLETYSVMMFNNFDISIVESSALMYLQSHPSRSFASSFVFVFVSLFYCAFISRDPLQEDRSRIFDSCS